MSLFQVFIGFLLLLSWAGRPILYKPAAKYFPAALSAAFTSTWLMVALIVTFPWLGHLLIDDYKNVFTSPYTIISIYKGVSLYWLIKLQQEVNKESTSSSVFLSFISLALGALANNLFFGEGLGRIKLLCIIGFGILGVFFLYKGDARRLSSRGKFAFAVVTLLMSSYAVSDHLAIPKIGWYSYLLFTAIFMFATGLLYGVSKTDFKNMFCSKNIAVAGAFYAVTEFLVIYASINILPVSIVQVFLRLSVPVVMVISALRYKEQSLKNQLVFGVVALCLALPIILLKN